MKQETTILVPLFCTACSCLVILSFGGMVRFPGGILGMERHTLGVSGEFNYFNSIFKGLSAYRADHGDWPPHHLDRQGNPRLPSSLTTPVAYLPHLPQDPWVVIANGRQPWPIYVCHPDEGVLIATGGPDGKIESPYRDWLTTFPTEAALDNVRLPRGPSPANTTPKGDLIHTLRAP